MSTHRTEAADSIGARMATACVFAAVLHGHHGGHQEAEGMLDEMLDDPELNQGALSIGLAELVLFLLTDVIGDDPPEALGAMSHGFLPEPEDQ